MGTTTKLILARIVLAIIGIHQLAIGAFGSISPEWSQYVAKLAWGATVNPTDQYFLVAILLNTYLIGLGLMLLFFSKNPARYSNLFWVPMVIFGLQIIETLVHYTFFMATFNVSAMALWTSVIISTITILLLGYLKPSRQE